MPSIPLRNKAVQLLQNAFAKAMGQDSEANFHTTFNDQIANVVDAILLAAQGDEDRTPGETVSALKPMVETDPNEMGPEPEAETQSPTGAPAAQSRSLGADLKHVVQDLEAIPGDIERRISDRRKKKTP